MYGKATIEEIADLMALHEEAIRDLYLVYSDKYPEYKEFFKILADEEQSHADLIRKYREKASSDKNVLKPGRFRPEMLNTAISFLEKEANKAQGADIPLINALTIALDLEKGMIERKFFEVFGGDPAELEAALKYLDQSTKKHIERIQIAWNENRYLKDN
jgi:rubrerythrin